MFLPINHKKILPDKQIPNKTYHDQVFIKLFFNRNHIPVFVMPKRCHHAYLYTHGYARKGIKGKMDCYLSRLITVRLRTEATANMFCM